MPVNVRSFGRWGLKVTNSRSLITQVTGAKAQTRADKIKEYFNGEIIQKISAIVSSAVVKEKISIVDLNAYLNELSSAAHEDIRAEFEKYGLSVVNFNIESINMTEEDRGRYQQKFELSSEALAAQANNVDFRTIKSFEILKKSAENESPGNALGGMLSAGIGLGVGYPLGQELSKNMSINSAPDKTNGQGVTERLRNLKSLLSEGLISEEQFKEKQSEILREV
jgi:membrane protease subunit (stomatin/prohibitin family)